MANQILGNIVDRLGTALNLPEYGRSEQIAGYSPTVNTGITASSRAAGFLPYSPANLTPANPTMQRIVNPNNVLGVSTSNQQQNNNQQNTGGQRQSNPNDPYAGFDMSFYPGWDQTAARADWLATGGAKGKSGGSGGVGVDTAGISDLYEPYLNELNNIENSLRGAAGKQLEDVTASYGQSQGLIQSERSDLEKALGLQEDQLRESGRSGYADAVRAYNALQQQGMSRYGSASSAGAALGELVGQEFLRSTGKQREQLQSGMNQLGLEKNRLGTYISGKVTDLDNWKREATQAINSNLQSKLFDINNRRADIESNKAADRRQALTDAINQARQIQQQDQTFKQSLAQFAVEQLQASSGRTFTPQEIAKVVNDMMGQTIKGFTGQNVNSGAGLLRAPSSSDEDAYKQLLANS